MELTLEHNLSLEDVIAHRFSCAPQLDAVPVLPTKWAKASGILTWRWHRVSRHLTFDRVLITQGDRVWLFDLDPIVEVRPVTNLTITAKLRQLTPDKSVTPDR